MLIYLLLFLSDDSGVSRLENCMMGISVLMIVMKIVVIWLCVNVDVKSLMLVVMILKISIVVVKVGKFFLICMLNMMLVSMIISRKFSMVSIMYGVCLLSRNLVWVMGVMYRLMIDLSFCFCMMVSVVSIVGSISRSIGMIVGIIVGKFLMFGLY